MSEEDRGRLVEGVDYVEINLTHGMVAWVSPEDADLAKMGFRAKRSDRAEFHHYYAVHSFRIDDYRGEYYLHDLVWERVNGVPVPKDKGYLIDHINQDKLDNRRTNLRLATRSQNEANKKKRRTQAGKNKLGSKYKGVTFSKDNKANPWRAIIICDKKRNNIGYFPEEKEAALAYDKEAYKMFGDYAFLNFPDELSKEEREKIDNMREDNEFTPEDAR